MPEAAGCREDLVDWGKEILRRGRKIVRKDYPGKKCHLSKHLKEVKEASYLGFNTKSIPGRGNSRSNGLEQELTVCI